MEQEIDRWISKPVCSESRSAISLSISIYIYMNH